MHILQEKLLKLVETENINGKTLREIAESVGDKFPQKIKHHLSQLEKRGLIRINKQKGTIEKAFGGVIKNSSLVSLPIVGSANCGPATIFANENVEGYLKISQSILKKKKDVYIIRANGISMNRVLLDGKTIEDGDYLLVDSSERTPRDGDVVVSVFDGMANIKKYFFDKENEQIVLMSQSSREFPPIYIHQDDDFMISGKVIQVIKKPNF